MGNLVILTGNVGKDPRIAYTTNGAAIANFTLATHERWTDKQSGKRVEATEWHRIVAWNGLAETVAEYVTQGRQLQVTGRLKTRSWTDSAGITRYVTEIHARDIEFLGGGRKQSEGQAAVPEQQITNPIDAATQGIVQGVKNLNNAKQAQLPGWDDIPF